jgi:4'-phosphopantetheinyl transferase
MTGSTFNVPPSVLGMSHDEIHIWCAVLDQPLYTIQRLANTLSIEERKRAERFHFVHDRRRFIVGRGVLRTLLANYLRVAPDDIQFCYGSNGKPFIDHCYNKINLHFNLSHSENYALFAFARDGEIGIDIEYVHFFSEMEEVAKQYFSINELFALQPLSNGEKNAAFFAFWTRKEALAKAVGMGLSHDLNQIDVTQRRQQLSLNVPDESKSNIDSFWSIQDLNLVPGFAAAVAVKGENWRLRFWQWSEKFTKLGSNNQSLSCMALN